MANGALAHVKRSETRYRIVVYIITAAFFGFLILLSFASVQSIKQEARNLVKEAIEKAEVRQQEAERRADERDREMKYFTCSLIIRQSNSTQPVEECVEQNKIPSIEDFSLAPPPQNTNNSVPPNTFNAQGGGENGGGSTQPPPPEEPEPSLLERITGNAAEVLKEAFGG